MSTAYTGVANVTWQSLGGASGTAQALGNGTSTFDFTGVPGSSTWMYVEDTSGGTANILSTLSPLQLPQVPGVTVPVVELDILQGVALQQANLAAVGGLNTAASQVVLMLTKGGAPYQGVQVSGGAGSADIAYDTGGCSYSDQATATGTGGTIVLLNSGLSGPTTLALTDTTTSTALSTPAFLTAHGAVTVLTVAF
jgi:hypothetical protein